MSVGTQELPAGATAEETEQFIDSVLAESRAAERSADGDGADTETRETDAGDETPAGDVAVVEKKDDEGQVETDADDADWRAEQEVKDAAAAIGLTDEELAAFPDREDLDRALTLFDRAALKFGREAAKPKEPEQEQKPPEQKAGERARGEDGKFVKAEKEQSATVEAGYKVSLDPDVYDEGVVKEFNAMRDHYESRLGAVEHRFEELTQAEQQRAIHREEEQFDTFVDTLSDPELFGVTGNETQEQLAAREKLILECRSYRAGLLHYGREAKWDQSLVNRLYNMVHSDRLSQQQRKQLIGKLKKQASQKMGGGSQVSKDRSWEGPITDDPDLLAEAKRLGIDR